MPRRARRQDRGIHHVACDVQAFREREQPQADRKLFRARSRRRGRADSFAIWIEEQSISIILPASLCARWMKKAGRRMTVK